MAWNLQKREDIEEIAESLSKVAWIRFSDGPGKASVPESKRPVIACILRGTLVSMEALRFVYGNSARARNTLRSIYAHTWNIIDELYPEILPCRSWQELLEALWEDLEDC